VVLTSRWKSNSLGSPHPTTLQTLRSGAQLSIGDDSGLSSVTISCFTRIAIGDRVLVGSGVLITDNDHHDIRASPPTARRHAGAPDSQETDRVEIGDDAFIGARSIILKGVTIGQGAVVGAGSVVTSDVPPAAIAAGNPARVIHSPAN
jgi:acetyltransferase-like isoleucine patch superfamily enzyme